MGKLISSCTDFRLREVILRPETDGVGGKGMNPGEGQFVNEGDRKFGASGIR